MPLLEGDHASSVPYPISFDTQRVHESHSIDRNLQQEVVIHQQEFIDKLMLQGSSNFPISFPIDNTNNSIVEESLCDQYNIREEDDQRKKSGKLMSSKMRIMRKMMSPDGDVTKKPRRSRQLLQDQQSTQANNTNNYPSDGVVRICSDCNTTKTPLWRSGPSGPKSLCNACGIRQRKARRALAAAAAAAGSGLIPAAAVAANKVRKDKDSDVDRTVPFKKRRRFSTAGGVAQKKHCFDDIVIRLNKSSAFHRVFPQDEKDAAILLMALSSGLMCS